MIMNLARASIKLSRVLHLAGEHQARATFASASCLQGEQLQTEWVSHLNGMKTPHAGLMQ
jgi:hypothetical protein